MGIRMWLIKILACGRPVAMNLYLTRGLYIDGTKSDGGFYYKVNVDRKPDDKDLPDDVGIHLYS